MRKKIKYPKQENFIVTINDFGNGIDVTKGENITKLYNAISCYNINFNQGVLTNGIGIKNLTICANKDSDEEQVEINKNGADVAIKKLWLFRQYSTVYQSRIDKLMFYADDGYCWCVKLITPYPFFQQLNVLQLTKTPNFANQKIVSLDSVIISNDTDGVYTWNGDGSPIHWPDCPKFVEFCEHKGKIYAVYGGEQNLIRYSKNYNVTDWVDILGTFEGNIEINGEQGKINKLISFLGYMFAVMDYGITKITTYENSYTYSISNMYISGNKIYPNTVAVCGEEIFMLTKDDLVIFNGTTTKKLGVKFAKMFTNIDNKNAVACFHAGKYYLACKLDFNDDKKIGCENYEHINNALICYDVKLHTYNIIRGVDILDIKSIQADSVNKVVCCFNDENKKEIGEITQDGKIFGKSTQKYWCSPLSDLGYSNKIKLVKEVSLLSKYDCKITVFTENDKKTFNVSGGKLLSTFTVRLKGKQIGFKIETQQDDVYISNLKLHISLIDNENV